MFKGFYASHSIAVALHMWIFAAKHGHTLRSDYREQIFGMVQMYEEMNPGSVSEDWVDHLFKIGELIDKRWWNTSTQARS